MKLSFIKKSLQKTFTLLVFLYGTVIFNIAFAADTDTSCPTGGGLSGIACNLVNSFQYLTKLITAGSFIAGLGFAVAAIFKFKAHRDNPTQIPIGTPIAMLFIAVLLLFMVFFFKQLGVTVFGSGTSAGGWSGVTGL